MARGWESKSIDDQIAEHEHGDRRASSPPDARAPRRETLHLARTRALQDLQVACDRRHRALLEDTIAHLDDELRRLG